jgi:hypothetical protein
MAHPVQTLPKSARRKHMTTSDRFLSFSSTCKFFLLATLTLLLVNAYVVNAQVNTNTTNSNTGNTNVNDNRNANQNGNANRNVNRGKGYRISLVSPDRHRDIRRRVDSIRFGYHAGY